MKEYQVTCIDKLERANHHSHITRIGNKSEGWQITREDAVRRIDSKLEAFYTIDYTTSKRVYLHVVREAGRQPYVQTWADGKWRDNLLALAECGTACRLVG
ncbi:MAG: DUF3892 domain-containing protein [Elusimicrobiota bacterium]